VYGSEVPAPCSSEVPAWYSSGGFVKVFADARGGGLSITVRKASNGSITVYRSRAVRCQLYIPLAGS
jgi:hypothetical protein